jgi:hypothetical protein
MPNKGMAFKSSLPGGRAGQNSDHIGKTTFT